MSSTSTYLVEKLPHLKQLKLFFMPQQFAPDRYAVAIEDECVTFTRKDRREDVTKIAFDCTINKEHTR
eukprot:CAMPEP_0197057546 /NCGR_PEP_ID=MMETSP1384-20130603/98240_1 /TAXON_ID=29189 /ORGANISM="Ammonia sp." /LENGTH=67 /DNA_ID=CAMNT_0042492015 /DNA_START=28 /DNA_END=227 /DNA_ORIENTATION=+